MIRTLKIFSEMDSDVVLSVKCSQNPPKSVFRLVIPRKSRLPAYTIDQDRLCQFEKEYSKDETYCFDVPIDDFVLSLSATYYHPTAIFCREPTTVEPHLDGAVD